MNIRLSLLCAIAGWAALTGCGGDSAEGDGGDQSTGCARDADCGSGYACDFGGNGTMSALPGLPGRDAKTLALDEECYGLCETACLASGEPEATCADDCTSFCSDGDEPEPEPDPDVDEPQPGTGGGPTMPGIPDLPPEDSDDPPPHQGVCRAITTEVGGSDGSGGTDAGTGGSDTGGTGGGDADPDIAWSGNWNVDLSYTAHCDTYGNISSKNQSHTLTVQLSGSNDSLTLTTGNHQMTGFGSNSGLTLNGTFPVRTTSDKDANTVKDDTRITIKLGDVQGPSSASGTIEGTYYATGFSAKCTVQDGIASFSR